MQILPLLAWSYTNPVFATTSTDFNTAAYRRLSHPAPSHTHFNYPMYTPGGGDQRWHPDVILGEDTHWVGGLMYAKLRALCLSVFKKKLFPQDYCTAVPF